MLIVKVELHSAVDGRVEELARMLIYNDGTGTGKLGNYGVRIARKGQTDREAYSKPQRTGEVKGYPRITSHVWNLVAKALKATDYK